MLSVLYSSEFVYGVAASFMY